MSYWRLALNWFAYIPKYPISTTPTSVLFLATVFLFFKFCYILNSIIHFCGCGCCCGCCRLVLIFIIKFLIFIYYNHIYIIQLVVWTNISNIRMARICSWPTNASDSHNQHILHILPPVKSWILFFFVILVSRRMPDTLGIRFIYTYTFIHFSFAYFELVVICINIYLIFDTQKSHLTKWDRVCEATASTFYFFIFSFAFNYDLVSFFFKGWTEITPDEILWIWTHSFNALKLHNVLFFFLNKKWWKNDF